VSDALSQNLAQVLGDEHLYFYDAIAPIVSADSIDMRVAFRASRYDKSSPVQPGDEAPAPEEAQEGGDYINCPLNEEQYHAFVAALVAAEKAPVREFEKELHFEGCMPIETLASRGPMTLAFGPFKPVGLRDPRTGLRPFAVLQLRAENREKTCYNLVGCQTKLKYGEQERAFRLAPGLENAEFLRLGSMHRNTFVNAPRVLDERLQLRARPGVYLAGQITGVEGYVESAACGLWLGLSLAARLLGQELSAPPEETALGALLGHLRRPAPKFQPSNVNNGLMPPLPGRMPKKKRKAFYGERGRASFQEWLARQADILKDLDRENTLS
jgi:methylenetetrahydrofolate--tRNA-(uracil-5-)-methyltransferase